MNIIFSGDRKSKTIAIGKKLKRLPMLGKLIKIALWDGYKSKIYLGTFLALTTYGGIVNAGNIVADMGQYMQRNPYDTRQMQEMKLHYNNNIYLNQKQESENRHWKGISDTLNTIGNNTRSNRQTQFDPLAILNESSTALGNRR